MNNLKLRTKLLAIALPPLAILALLVAYAMKVAFVDGSGADSVELRADLQVLGVVGLAGVLGSALVLLLVTRSVTTPLDRLTQAADELSSNRLPALVELLRSSDRETLEALEAMPADADDELGRLATALGGVHAAAARVTEAQRGLVKESITALVVNLARRNQALLDRQLQLIDELETNEDDPDRLEQLYRLDHLATRMRRNAESLLVLAGAETPRRRGAPVELMDVVRVAMGEIEDYRHVELGGIQSAQVGAPAAVDLSHLLAELLENATQFSPPDAPVVVEGGRAGDGTYTITVTDRGIGMNERQLADANEVVRNPPELGLELSRSLGFLVVGRLATRLGVTTSLTSTPGGGVTATLSLPAALLVEGPVLAPGPDRRPQHRNVPPPVVPPASGGAPVPPAPTHIASHTPPSGAGADRPTGDGPLSTPPSGAEGGPGPLEPAAGPGPAGDRPASPWSLHQAGQAPPAAPPAQGPMSDGSGSLDHPSIWHPVVEPVHRPAAPAVPAVPAADGPQPVGAPQPDPSPTKRLAEALPYGKAFEDGLAALLGPAPGSDTGGGDRTQAGLVRRRRGEQAPAEQAGRPVAASGRTPEEIREMLARYRDGIKHRRPDTTGIEPGAGTPPEEDLR